MSKGGYRVGAGNPGEPVLNLRRKLIQLCLTEWTTEEDVKLFWKNLLKIATRGDANAAKLIAPYLLGPAPTAVDIRSESYVTTRVRPDLSSLTDDDLARLDSMVRKTAVKETALIGDNNE